MVPHWLQLLKHRELVVNSWLNQLLKVELWSGGSLSLIGIPEQKKFGNLQDANVVLI
jgi:hypothetical protein